MAEDKAPYELCQEATFTKIFQEYARTLHNYLYYKSGNRELSQDLTQEAFSRLWQRCREVALSAAKGYVFKTANNLLLNNFNHQKVVLEHQGNLAKEKVDNPQFLLEQKEFQLRLEEAINDLPEKQRVVFLLSRVDKKTYKEIAELLGISKQAVEKRMYNALDKLRLISKLIK